MNPDNLTLEQLEAMYHQRLQELLDAINPWPMRLAWLLPPEPKPRTFRELADAAESELTHGLLAGAAWD